MQNDYPTFFAQLQNQYAKLARELRGPLSAFARLTAATVTPGALDAKTKELIALGIGIAARCEGCIAYHVHDAIQAGASREEILEAIGVAVMMGGGPAVISACGALEALDQFLTAGSVASPPESI